MIDVAALRTLHAVDVHGSVVAAAEAIGFTPSAVSQQVKRLERQAGVGLLERVGRGVVLTEQGRRLVDQGQLVLAELERIESELHASSGQVGGTLRVVAFSTAMRGLVAPVTADLQRRHSDLVVRLQEVEPWDAIDLVSSGHADLGVVHRWGDVPLDVGDHVESRSLLRDAAEVIVSVDHRLADRGTVGIGDLLEEGWIATPAHTICRQWLGRMYDGTGHAPQIAHQAMEFSSHLAMVDAGLGIALVPQLGREPLPPGVVGLRLDDPEPTREVIALWRRSRRDSPAVRAFADGLVAATS